MATIVLGAAGMAMGGAVGGSVLGLSSAVIGRAAGATLGRVIDERLLGQGSDPVETGRVDRLRLTGASEGAPVGRAYGQARVGGQVIWASQFLESSETSGGGKGRPSQHEVTEYSYSVSLAVAVCEGQITRIGRVWADGQEVPVHQLNMRVYKGGEAQLPDPKIEAVEGAGNAPAYRGIAYVVFEDLPLGQFGNRVPSFSFEVSRPAEPGDLGADGVTPPDMARAIRGVALMPGSGEYALATTPVSTTAGYGRTKLANVNTDSGVADAVSGLDALEAELPNCGSVSLIVSWFGDDLRAGDCTLRPKVEHKDADGDMPWQVTGLDRDSALRVPYLNGSPVYGGTPTDQSVIQIIADMGARGQDVVFYPFILMDQLSGNTLTDPWTGQTGQANLPWRGRITTALAPGVAGSPDGTAAAEAEVAAFFGTAQPGDFSQTATGVDYSGPNEWSYRRFILHYAHLCAAAGGVDAFCIGSEMRGLTQIRGAGGSYPAVAALVQLARDVRQILGAATRIGYAADWSEYHGHQPVGTADKHFHLDPLWADDDIDFIGIDNYMPLSDWRDGDDHADAHWGSIYNLDYLRSQVEGGEGYDWYYASDEDRDAQIRTPIEDFYGEEFLWRYKDIRGWWSNYHHNRVNGQRAAAPTAWEPGLKPIWFTEFGCAAIDKGTNQPNKFLDPKSSESFLPYYSRGWRDEYMQMQYLRAFIAHWSDPAHNPVSVLTGKRMLDMDKAHVWSWDARPFPAFPARADIWSDGDNWTKGHWITGRTASRPLDDVVEELCAEAGLRAVDTSELYGLVRGYTLDSVTTIRSALQPLMLAYGFDAIERDGQVIFRTRTARLDGVVPPDGLALSDDQDEDARRTRAAEAEIAGRVRLGFVAAGGRYEAGSVEVVHPHDGSRGATRNEMPLSLYRGEAQDIVERWLAEARVSRDSASFALPPSRPEIGAGDVVQLDDGEGLGIYRIDRVETGLQRQVEATRIDRSAYAPRDTGSDPLTVIPARAPVPVEALFLDLPLLSGDELPHAPRFAPVSDPWPGPVALYQSATDSNYALAMVRDTPASVGITETVLEAAPAGRWDRGPALRVSMVQGALASVTEEALLAGANLAAIGDGSPDGWEVFQFAEAELVGPGQYALRLRLRGQAGSDGVMPPSWPAGSRFVVINGRVPQVPLTANTRGTLRHFRFGPSDRTPDHPSFRAATHAFAGNGLRPYPVCHFSARTTAGDVAMGWIRRTRIDGDGWEGFEVPLGEAQERYRVRIREGGTLRREIITSAPELTYTAAQRAADGTGTSFTAEIAQISDRFGPGPGRSWQVEV
ncbi:baseplate multidomain protein megatron [Roseisalinus antarcticus]|uniref:Host specificity protein n=1 Tax=Roseisalinus antarcticus TaxID=254357 RepID=A0A1Y5T2J9_9RHOB|nr:glycoside hydrolase/phage tail family protein [Roseisalinus antarcticus]SLN54449.1 hypothetical protein ROA7023_02437 [Roseisalinus antarcticus]